MSTAMLSIPRPIESEDWVAVEDGIPESGRISEARRSLAESWVIEDKVDQLLAELRAMGRVQEATAIDRVLTGAEELSAERMLAALASDAFAEDWDSEEDSIYDSL